MCWATGDYQNLIQQLDDCKVRFRPTDMGLKRNQLGDVLEHAPQWFTSQDVTTILKYEPIVGERFEEFWEFITLH